jgi:hypothetical protein
MKRLVVVALGAALWWTLPGCTGYTMTETPVEASARRQRVLDLEQRELNDDVDLLFHMDRPSRLSRTRVD